MRAAEARFETAAARVTRASTEPATEVDVGTELVSMSLASYDFNASAKIAEVGRAMMKTTIDLLA